MTTTFRVVKNQFRPGDAIEVLKDGAVCAVVYPGDGVSDIIVMSAHFEGDLAEGKDFPAGVTMENGAGRLPIPCVRMRFEPRPYDIVADRIVRRQTH